MIDYGTPRTVSHRSGPARAGTVPPIPRDATVDTTIVASMLFDDLGPVFTPTARGTASKRFVVRVFALTAGDELAVADSRPITLNAARKLEVRARKSDALDVITYDADAVPPMPDGMKQITELRGISITVEPDLIDLMRSRARAARENESTHRAALGTGGATDDD